MTEQLHISNPDSSELTPTTGEHDDDQPDYSPEEMAQLNAATTGVIDILNRAPELVPGVADVITQIQQEQADQKGETSSTDTADRDNMTLAA